MQNKTKQDIEDLQQIVSDNSSAIGQISNDRGYITAKRITPAEMETTFESGKYFVSTTGFLDVTAHDTTPSSYCKQILYYLNGGLVKFRTRNLGVWTPWRPLIYPELISNPNLLINGDFQIWQRGLSLNIPIGKTTYTADRWCINSDVTSTVSLADNGFKVVNTSIGHYLNIMQILEDILIESIIGKKVTLTVEFASGIENVNNIGYMSYNGTEISASSAKNGNIMTHTFTPTILNKNYIFIQMAPNTINKSVVIKNVKLELGEIATSFSPRTNAEELAMCLRYYMGGYWILSGAPYTMSQTDLYFMVTTPTQMRTVPTIIAGDTRVEVSGVIQPGFSFEAVNMSRNSISVRASKANHGISPGVYMYLASQTGGYDAELY